MGETIENPNYREIINTVPQMIWKIDRNLKTVYSNRAWKKYTGGDFEVLDSKIIHKDDFINTICAYENSKKSSFFEVTRRIKNSENIYHWFLTRGIWLNDFCYGTCTDINELTELKKEQLLAESTRISLSKYAALLAQDAKDSKEEKELAELVRLSLVEDAKLLAQDAKDSKEEKELAELVRLSLVEDAKLLAVSVLEKEQKSENNRINLEQIAIVNEKEKVKAEITRIELEETAIEKENTRKDLFKDAKRLKEMALQKEKEKLLAEHTRVSLVETAIIKEKEKIIAENTRLSLVETAIIKEKEKIIAENARISLEEIAIQKEKEKMIAEQKRIELEEIAIQKEKDKLLADKNRIKLEETAALLATEVITKEKERIINDKHRSELEKHNLELTEAKYAEEELLSFISHEIRNSLYQTISMNSFLQETSLTNEQQEYLTMLKNSSDFMLRLINNLLDKKKSDYNNIQLQTVDLNLFFEQVVKTNEKQIEEKNILFNKEIPKFNFAILTNYDKFLEIFTNLIGNAIKFTDKGSISLIVKIVNETENKLELEIVISDTGIGIQADKIDNLFKPFTQSSDYIKEKYGGSGLGLSICKKIITLMNGTIFITSVFNEGTTFTINLPFEKKSLQ
jgi:signal transduction histidine kinase